MLTNKRRLCPQIQVLRHLPIHWLLSLLYQLPPQSLNPNQKLGLKERKKHLHQTTPFSRTTLSRPLAHKRDLTLDLIPVQNPLRLLLCLSSAHQQGGRQTIFQLVLQLPPKELLTVEWPRSPKDGETRRIQQILVRMVPLKRQLRRDDLNHARSRRKLRVYPLLSLLRWQVLP